MRLRRRPTPFIVLTHSRNGSAWLIDTLSSHPAIAAHGELFHPREDGTPTYGTGDTPYFRTYIGSARGKTRAARLYYLVRYLSKVYAGGDGVRAAGFKLQYAHAWMYRGMWQYFAARRVRVVHLIRTNSLDALLSYQAAKQRSQFHPRRGETIPAATLWVEPEGLQKKLEEREQAVAWARSNVERFRLPRVEVVYEELVRCRDETLSGILQFLGLDPDVAQLDSDFVRINAGSKTELIENLEEVRARLAATRFEWMLRDSR